MCTLLRPKEKTLYVAWVGDSQALLVEKGKVLQCVYPHKPSREVRDSSICTHTRTQICIYMCVYIYIYIYIYIYNFKYNILNMKYV